MAYYLVEAKDDDELFVRLFKDAAKLADWLREELAIAHYSDYGYQDIKVYKLAEGGKLEKLTLTHKGTNEFDEEDYSTVGYEVTSASGVEATFSFTIDGRA